MTRKTDTKWNGYTEVEQVEITRRLKLAAVAVAEVWDAIREVEHDDIDLEIELGNSLLFDLAGNCDHPPTTADLLDEDVWQSFVETSTTNQTEGKADA
jgi:hypothetical protein